MNSLLVAGIVFLVCGLLLLLLAEWMYRRLKREEKREQQQVVKVEYWATINGFAGHVKNMAILGHGETVQELVENIREQLVIRMLTAEEPRVRDRVREKYKFVAMEDRK